MLCLGAGDNREVKINDWSKFIEQFYSGTVFSLLDIPMWCCHIQCVHMNIHHTCTDMCTQDIEGCMCTEGM